MLLIPVPGANLQATVQKLKVSLLLFVKPHQASEKLGTVGGLVTVTTAVLTIPSEEVPPGACVVENANSRMAQVIVAPALDWVPK
jgi:hypothetical protein